MGGFVFVTHNIELYKGLQKIKSVVKDIDDPVKLYYPLWNSHIVRPKSVYYGVYLSLFQAFWSKLLIKIAFIELVDKSIRIALNSVCNLIKRSLVTRAKKLIRYQWIELTAKGAAVICFDNIFLLNIFLRKSLINYFNQKASQGKSVFLAFIIQLLIQKSGS